MISEKPGMTISEAPIAAPAPAQNLPSASLPDQPLIKIRPSRRWSFLDLHDIWAHRELFYFLVWRDVKVRYKQTVLGASWVILQPLLMTIIFMVFLGMIIRVQTPGVPYPLFLYAALLPWTFFSNAVASSSHSVVANATVINKVEESPWLTCGN